MLESERNGASQKRQLDYEAIKAGQSKSGNSALPSSQEVRSHSRAQNDVAVEDDAEDEAVSSTKFAYKPEASVEDMIKETQKDARRRSAVMRAEQLMAAAGPPKRAATVSLRSVSGSHLRLISSITAPDLVPPKPEVATRPRVTRRTDSAETSGSTPMTDSTEYVWSEKVSTAMTSAAVTPARSSKRTSSQALHAGLEIDSAPKVDSVDPDWIRTELEKAKKAHGERMQQEREEDALGAKRSAITDSRATQTGATPAAVRIPRKPVGHPRNTSQHYSEPATVCRQNSGASEGEIRQVSLAGLIKDIPTGPIKPQPQHYPPHTREAPSRPSAPTTTRAPSRARSISRKVRDFVRPGSSQGRQESADVPARPPSRSASAVRQVREYFKPSSGRPSTDAYSERPGTGQRKRSMDSFHSASSHMLDPAKKGWQGRGRGSAASDEHSSRPGTADDGADRGRAITRTKRPIDLNRDLPPLPGLDQWKDEEVIEDDVPPAPPKHHSHVSQPSRDEILATRTGSPTPSNPSLHVGSAAPPVPSAPSPATPPGVSANFSNLSDFNYDHYSTSTTSPSLSINSSPRFEDGPHQPRLLAHRRDRSQTVEDSSHAQAADRARQAAGGLGRTASTMAKPVFAGKATVVDFSGSLQRKPSTISRASGREAGVQALDDAAGKGRWWQRKKQG